MRLALPVKQLDALRFEPSSIEVKPGETVTFRITNTGTLIHQFSLGNVKAQAARDSEMKGMGSAPMSMADTGNERTVQPDATEEIT